MNGSAPVTQGDMKVVKDDIRLIKDDIRLIKDDVQRIEKKFDQKFERLYEADDQILTVLTNMDKRLMGKVEDHEKRIVRLEEAVA
ncbi:hypothetical protein HYZ98_02205 [Candidatus Peregrinibacteria bacterium]|nr:hypothetical protein [Candidatus Peregrinibacteria bacterium]